MNTLSTIGKFIPTVLLLLLAASATTIRQERNDRVSNVPPAALFPYYNGLVTVNHSPTTPTVRISAFSGDCGVRFFSEVQRVNHAMVVSGTAPASIELDESDPGQGVDNCFDPTVCMTEGAINIEHIGPLPSLHHYSVFTSVDGRNLKLLINLAPSANALYLAAFKLPNNAQFYVKAVGQPLVRNHFVGPVKQCQ